MNKKKKKAVEDQLADFLEWIHQHPDMIACVVDLTIQEREAKIRELKNALQLCASMARTPDPVEGCNKIIEFVKQMEVNGK